MNNPNNILITKEKVEDILNFFGNIGQNGERLLIKNLDFYQRAFIHESYHQSVLNFMSTTPSETENKKPQPIYIDYVSKESNERLEYLGDHVLKATLSRYLYERFSTEREGFLTRLKIKIEKCSMLHQIAVELGFKKYLLLSLQIENQTTLDIDRGRSTPSIYEDAFESFLGSIMEDFKESGYVYAERFLRNIIENVIDFSELISKNDNFKDSLQRFFQSLKWKTPIYVNVNEEGPLYRKVFTRLLFISKEQLNELNNQQKANIIKYTQDCLEFYKCNNNNVFLKLFEKTKCGHYILCLGKGRRVTESEQMAAETGLTNLLLEQNY